MLSCKGNDAVTDMPSLVYSDEPIPFPASRNLRDIVPQRIREMRRLAWTTGHGANESSPKLFYRQGKFMEDFRDDCEYAGESIHYFPTYQALTDAELRGYFTWRTKARQGRVTPTSLSFVFLHIYELLNQIGVPSPEEGFRMLRDFWTEYGAIDPRINRYVPVWLKDYAVYYDLDKSLLADSDLPDAGFDSATATLLSDGPRGAAEIFSALNALSSYDLSASKLYAKHPGDVRECVQYVFERIPSREKLFGRLCPNTYFLFNSAVFYDRVVQKDRDYVLSENHVYRCREGGWTCERFVWHGKNNKRIGAILKTIDYFMRQSRGIKSTLRPGDTNKAITAKIENAVAGFEAENRRVEIEIDVEKLGGIRAAAETTRDRLIVEDSKEPDGSKEVNVEAPVQTRMQTSPAGLTEAESLFLKSLLRGGRGEHAVVPGHMPSLLMDGINEKLFDTFNDAVLAEGGDGVIEAISDYLEPLKGMFPE